MEGVEESDVQSARQREQEAAAASLDCGVVCKVSEPATFNKELLLRYGLAAKVKSTGLAECNLEQLIQEIGLEAQARTTLMLHRVEADIVEGEQRLENWLDTLMDTLKVKHLQSDHWYTTWRRVKDEIESLRVPMKDVDLVDFHNGKELFHDGDSVVRVLKASLASLRDDHSVTLEPGTCAGTNNKLSLGEDSSLNENLPVDRIMKAAEKAAVEIRRILIVAQELAPVREALDEIKNGVKLNIPQTLDLLANP